MRARQFILHYPLHSVGENPKLKQWWNSLPQDQQTAWFVKWQTMGAKRRYDSMSFTERSVHAHDLIDDEIGQWLPFDEYYNRNYSKPGNTLATLKRDFEEIVNSQRHNCRVARGQWCIPVFGGLERRNRQRVSNEYDTSRGQSSVSDQNQLQRLRSQADEQLRRSYEHVVAPVVILPQLPVPQISARQEDQPALVNPQDGMYENISREV